jgi:hypothetical protein
MFIDWYGDRSDVSWELLGPEEFYPLDRYPASLVPRPSLLRRLWCRATGGHAWRKFPYGWIHRPFDADLCDKCWKMRGPLPVDRDTPMFG